MRTPTQRQKPRTSELQAFPAATAGWISNQNLAAPTPGPQGAAVLENIFPTAETGIVRRGSELYATLGGGDSDTTALFSYNNGNNRKLFGATATTIYDITVITSASNYTLATEDGDDIVTDLGDHIGQLSTGGLEVVENQTGGDWMVTQFATTGGVYLVCVNGEDPLELYDGDAFFPIDEFDIYTLKFDAQTVDFSQDQVVTGGTSGATGYIVHATDAGTTGTLYLSDVTGTFADGEAITGATDGSATVDGVAETYYVGIDGVDTSTLNYVWSYKSRLFFIEKDSMNAWYLPVDQVGGTAVKFPMGGIFSLGGSLMFGAAWSLDSSGDGGLSEQCVFVTDEGEVAVFQGKNPGDAADWSKVGTYKIGKPLGRKAFIRAGGDLIIATDVGDVPLSQAIQRDIAALSPAAVSYPIETEWNKAVELRRTEEWHCVVWPERQMFVVALPTVNEQPAEMFIANARTGAWAKFTGWDGKCLEVFEGRLFFGSTNGRVVEAYVTGLDEGETYTSTYVPLFVDFGSPASLKIAEIARVVTRSAQDINPQLSAMIDYTVDLPPAPAAAPIAGGSQWGVGLWGTAMWGQDGAKKIQQAWDSVGGAGYAMAPAVQITSGSVIPLDAEIIRLELSYQTAEIIT